MGLSDTLDYPDLCYACNEHMMYGRAFKVERVVPNPNPLKRTGNYKIIDVYEWAENLTEAEKNLCISGNYVEITEHSSAHYGGFKHSEDDYEDEGDSWY